jgi:hypothetical protein
LSNSGSAYVFEKSDVGTWAQAAKLTADGAENDQFGWSVSVSGSTVAVGALQHDGADASGASLSNSGAAYVFNNILPPRPCTCCERSMMSMGLFAGCDPEL